MITLDIRRILVPLDFSKTSLKALAIAINISKKYDSEILLLNIVEGIMTNAAWGNYVPPTFELEYNKSLMEQIEEKLADIEDQVRKKKVSKVRSLTANGRIHQEVVKAQEKNKADLIVMGTHGVSGFREFFVGSNTFSVVRDAKCPVLSVPGHAKSADFKNLLLPFRDRPHSREKVNFAIAFARKYGAKIHILGIDTEETKAHKRKIELQAEQIQKIAEKNAVTSSVKVISGIYKLESILKHAKTTSADLVMAMSDMDRMDIGEYFTGPFSQQIVNHSPIPVLSIHPKFNPNTIDLTFY